MSQRPDEALERESSDTIWTVALAVIIALLVLTMVLFMWTSDRDGKIVRFIAWAIPSGFLVFGIVAWLMTPRPVKPKR
jgi:hypothetical protein